MNGMIKDKRVLVTGSSGVIGLELLKLLIANKAKILSTDRYPLPPEYDKQVTHIQQDLAVAPLNEIHNFQPETIFHLAASFERAKESRDFWRINWHDNMRLSHNLIDQAKDVAALKTFVFASSYLIYAPSIYLSHESSDRVAHLKEVDLVHPRNITGVAKYYTEHELSFIKEYYKPSLCLVNARIYRVYGCGSRDVISRWVRAALSNQPIELYNKQSRFDYIYAGDVAEGLLRLAECPEASGLVNLGSGIAHKVQDIISILADYFPGLKVSDLGRKEALEASCADLTKLKHLTGWSPRTEFEHGIQKIIEFEKGKVLHGR